MAIEKIEIYGGGQIAAYAENGEALALHDTVDAVTEAEGSNLFPKPNQQCYHF